jgi:hypothetical protein
MPLLDADEEELPILTKRIPGPLKNDFISGPMPSMPRQSADRPSPKVEEGLLLTKAGSFESHSR